MKDVNLTCGCAFSMGCIKRSMGGMRSSLHLKEIIGVLQEIIKMPDSALHVWGLHALCLCIEAAGPSVSGLVNDTMEVVYR